MVSALFWFAFCFFLAGLEVEIEGDRGWAETLPTWYRTTGFFARLYGFFVGKRPLTGYHLYVTLLPLLVVHARFADGVPWSPSAECLALATYFVVCSLWDFLWFVLNPHFGIAKFRKENIWWYANSWWIGGVFPADYLYSALAALGMAAVASLLSGDPNAFIVFAISCAVQGALVALTVLLAPLYHRWYWRMRRRDDRDKTNIFHK
jgi:hypothetical protein